MGTKKKEQNRDAIEMERHLDTVETLLYHALDNSEKLDSTLKKHVELLQEQVQLLILHVRRAR